MVFLSATTPNMIDFSDWIGRTKRRPVYVITTGYRPVPLYHYLYAGRDLHKIMDNRGVFYSDGYKSAKDALLSKKER